MLRAHSGNVMLISALVIGAAPAFGQSYDLKTDWSDTQNPNGAWAYREGNNPLPAIDWFQQTFCSNNGGWSGPTGGWAQTADAQGRIPWFFKSRGNETATACGGAFQRDWQAGDVVMHSYDPSSGFGGTGEGSVTWTSPFDGTITISGSIWPGRDIGRSNDWVLTHEYLLGGLPPFTLASGTVASGDAFSRAVPQIFSAFAPVPTQLVNRTVAKGDVLRLLVRRTSGSVGDFVGMNMTIATCVGVTQQPQDARVCPGSDVQFTAAAVSSTGVVNYAWFRGNTPLTNTAHYSGVFTPMLTVHDVTAAGGADNAFYHCVITGGCQVAMTREALLSVRVPCNLADVTGVGGPSAGNCGDTQLTADDVIEFLSAFFDHRAIADVASLGGTAGPDGLWTPDDIIVFLTAFFAGCPG